MNALFLLLLSVVPQVESVVEDRVDIVEDNQVYNVVVNDDGTVNIAPSSLRQLIFRETDWQGPHIVDWRTWTKDCVPQEDGKGKFILWYDLSNGRCVLRRVRFRVWIESHTTYDNEAWEREFFPNEWRRKLREPRQVKP